MTVTRTHTYPEGTPPGIYTITATDGVNTAQAQVTILDSTPNVVEVTPESVQDGGTVSVTGNGYEPETAGTLTITPEAGGEAIATANITTDAEGVIPATDMLIPEGTAAGSYTVTAEVGVETGETTLTVTNQEQLAAPTGLTTGSVTDTSIEVNWTAVANANRYVMEYRAQGTTQWNPLPAVLTEGDTANSLTPGTTYEFRVIAQDSNGVYADSDPSAIHSEETTGGGPTPLPAPTGVVTSNETDTSVQLDWTAVTGSDGYVVQYREQGATDWSPEPQTTEVTLVVDELTAATPYEFQVKAVGDGTTNADSAFAPDPPATADTLPPALPAPTTPAIGAVTTDSVTVEWDEVTGVVGYIVRWRQDGTTDWNVRDQVTTLTDTVDALTAATTYEFQVKAVGDGTTNSDSVYTPDPPLSQQTQA